MKTFLFVLFLWLIPHVVLGQAGPSPFARMMETAKVKAVIRANTVAGVTRILLTSGSVEPRFVFVFAPGGDGAVDFSTSSEGMPISSRPGNPAFSFSSGFLRREAAWAIIGIPTDYKNRISEGQRLDPEHIEAVAQVGQRIRDAYPKAKLILIGHSNGGITAGMQAIRPKPVFDAIVMSAPNLDRLPVGWKPEKALAPILFITHKDDTCRATSADKTVRMAGDKFPLVVIETPSPGNPYECFNPPAPHFFSGVYEEYSDALLKWAAGL